MECNKDEALRAKLIAESKLETKDFAGAKKFALKAKTLYPYLDGIMQLMTTIDVCISGENKIGGLANWYGMLGVKPSDDDETIRKQYRKLALLLHPDKNKSAGADGAFKLISEAWRVLSDKAKRAVYDQCSFSKGSLSKVHTHASGPSAPPSGGNGIFNFTGRAASVPKTQKKSSNAPVPPTPPSNQRPDSFWTICHQCKMHYEYQRQYLNQNLLCPTCRDVFHAIETAPPYYFTGSSNEVPRQRQQTSEQTSSDRAHKQDAPVSKKSGSGQATSNSFWYRHHHQGRHSGTTGIGTADTSVAQKAANGMAQAHGTLKRVSTESPVLESEGSLKKRKVDNGTTLGIDHHIAQGNGGNGTASGSAPGSRIPGFSGTFRSSNSIMRDLTPAETRNLLIMKARKDILNKLSTMQSESTEKARKKEENKTKQSNGEGSIANAKEHNQNGYNDSPSANVAKQPGKDQSNRSARDANEEEETQIAATMSVPDPEFHDFDQDRSESSFGDNEVWAAYDDDDGMPRFFALINKVISRKPFKLRISWLNSKTNEFSTIDWVGSGFYKTCGEFRVGKYEICKFINSFSHKVNWSKGPRGAVLLFPKKGDVWAIFRNWSPDWNEQTPDEVIHKYDMVLVLDEYNEESGISVAPLVKVSGFKAIFRPNMDAEAMKKIPKAEMFRFSHQVPYMVLTGQEAQNAPKGFFELDPAATPLELLQVITESNGISMDSNELTAAEEQSIPSISLDDSADAVKAVHAVDVTGNGDSAP